MRGFEGFLVSVLLPFLFLSIFGLAIVFDFRRDWRNRHRWAAETRASAIGATKELFKLGALSVWMLLMLFLIYRELRIHYDLWELRPENVKGISVGKHRFGDQRSIAQILGALKSSEWYSVNHGGWGDETPIVIETSSGEEWQLRAGYHFAQHGAVVIRYSAPNGRG